MASDPQHSLVSSNTDHSKTVAQRLRERLEPQNDLVGRFLPKSALTDILIGSTIQSILQQLHKPDTDPIDLQHIIGAQRRVKILAILLLTGNAEYLAHFIQHEICDNNLPLQQCDLVRCFGLYTGIVDTFIMYQSKVNVPVWDFPSPDISEQVYHEEQRLPFLTKEELGRGGQGKIWRVRVHQDHYRTRAPSVCGIAEPQAQFLFRLYKSNLVCLSEPLGAFPGTPVLCRKTIQP